MFTAADIKKHQHKQPFVPFRLVTSSGESFDILHPELVMVDALEITIGRPNPNDSTVYEDQIWVSLLHVASNKEIPAAIPQAGGNGQANS